MYFSCIDIRSNIVNILHIFYYAWENLESDLEYEFNDSSKEELEYYELTWARTKHVNPMWFIPDRYYAFTKKSYILMVKSFKYNFYIIHKFDYCCGSYLSR